MDGPSALSDYLDVAMATSDNVPHEIAIHVTPHQVTMVPDKLPEKVSKKFRELAFNYISTEFETGRSISDIYMLISSNGNSYNEFFTAIESNDSHKSGEQTWH